MIRKNQMVGRDLLGNFINDRRGVAALEFMLIAPLLILVLLGTFSIFEWLRSSYVTERATFTVADMVSRQDQKDDAFLAKVGQTFEHLAARHVGKTELKIMSLTRNDKGFNVDWTYSVNAGALAKSAVPLDLMPVVAQNDSVIVTQTRTVIQPAFSYLYDVIRPGMRETNYGIELKYTATVRPRFGGRIRAAEAK